MKVVQVGILVTLVICAVLLVLVYRGQLQVQRAPIQMAAPAAAPAAASVQPAPAPVVTAPAPAPVVKKPSPARKQPPTVMVAETTQAPPPPSEVKIEGMQMPAPEPPAPPAPDPPALSPPPGTQTAPPAPRVPAHVTIPAGTQLVVRLAESLSSEHNQPGDTWAGTLDQPLVIDGFEIASRGARVQGKVVEVRRGARVKGGSGLTIALVRLRTTDGQEVPVTTESFTHEAKNSRSGDVAKVGVGAAIGAAIGAIAGGGKGAAIGAGVGGAAGAGTVAATRGKASQLPVETRVTFHLQEPVSLTERLH